MNLIEELTTLFYDTSGVLDNWTYDDIKAAILVAAYDKLIYVATKNNRIVGAIFGKKSSADTVHIIATVGNLECFNVFLQQFAKQHPDKKLTYYRRGKFKQLNIERITQWVTTHHKHNGKQLHKCCRRSRTTCQV